MVDCDQCVNRGRIYLGTQEPCCSHCIHEASLRRDLYDEGPAGGVPHRQCDGCARGLPVISGNHHDENGPVQSCTADRYTTDFSEQVAEAAVNVYHYRVTFKPQSILPDIDFRGDAGAAVDAVRPDRDD